MFNFSLDALKAGQSVFNSTSLIERLGGGSMSTVYQAHDMRRGKHVVIVELLNSEIKQEIFRREPRALSQLEHPTIVSVLDYDWSGPHRCHYLVFEYLPHTLLQEIAKYPNERHQEWYWLLRRQMADALPPYFFSGEWCGSGLRNPTFLYSR